MVRKVFGSLLVLSLMGSAIAGEVEQAKEQLDTQLALIERISKHIKRPHLGRIAVLRTAVKRVRESIETKGVGHSHTNREYQNLIIAFRSRSFFQRARPEIVAKEIDELLKIADDIATQRGIDDEPYTHITASIYSQMRQLFIQLEEVTNDEPLKKELADLRVPMGIVISKGKQGDRLLTLINAIPLFQRIRALYPQLDKVGFSDPAFNTALEIQGLNDYFAEVSQLEQLTVQEMVIVVRFMLDRDPMVMEALEKMIDETVDEDDKELITKIVALLKEHARK